VYNNILVKLLHVFIINIMRSSPFLDFIILYQYFAKHDLSSFVRFAIQSPCGVWY